MPRCLILMGDPRSEMVVKVAHPGGISPEIGSTNAVSPSKWWIYGWPWTFWDLSLPTTVLILNHLHPHPEKSPLWSLRHLHWTACNCIMLFWRHLTKFLLDVFSNWESQSKSSTEPLSCQMSETQMWHTQVPRSALFSSVSPNSQFIVS